MAALARRARIGRLAGIIIGPAAGMVAVWYNQVWLAPTAVGAGYLAGVLAGELVSPSQPARSLRVASLQARGARQYLPGGSVPVARPTRGPQERARRNAGRAIAGAVLGIEFLAVGSLAILAGDGLDVPPGSDADAYLGSRILDWAGLGTALAGLLVWCLLGWWRRGPAGAPEAVTDQPVPG